MKDIRDYIVEAKEDKAVLNSLTVKFSCPDEVTVQTPESMSESDIQIYLDDILLDKMPLESKIDDLKKNKEYLDDVYFEYENMDVALGTAFKADIEWDDHYDPSLNSTAMNVMKIKGLKYCGHFEKFEMEDIDADDDSSIRETLKGLFDGMAEEVNDDLPFKVTISDDDKDIEWDSVSTK